MTERTERTEFIASQDPNLVKRTREYSGWDTAQELGRAFLRFQGNPEGFAKRAQENTLTMEDATRFFDETMFGAITRPEAYRALRAGIRLTDIAPKSEMINRVKHAIQGVSRISDKKLEKVNDIIWDKEIHKTFGHGSPKETPVFGYLDPKKISIHLNPAKESPRTAAWTIGEEVEHAQQYARNTPMNKLIRDAGYWLRRQTFSPDKKEDEMLRYSHDPVEVQAKYIQQQRMKTQPIGKPSSPVQEELWKRQSLRRVAADMAQVAKDYPHLAVDMQKFSMGIQNYIDKLDQGAIKAARSLLPKIKQSELLGHGKDVIWTKK